MSNEYFFMNDFSIKVKASLQKYLVKIGQFEIAPLNNLCELCALSP